ncbi:undecaprenyldiphospho-muramoylpentapeptide beta-N-acetylglucosaminyltransferase [Candidatus Falkowbacteria bacterium RIFOXYC2_FULL_46_15]|nr:MAG: undecaprenyldiphospho-muramoylpentapeptide beta-N-acetylglucosaminyltransferase [Candidatus Falkowbacteria bacterium RIFOXYC2_FULL_46_15]
MPNRKRRIIFSGGGTGGSVTPPLAIAEELREREIGGNAASSYEFLWLGTKKGPEKTMVEPVGIEFRAIASGKLRRYFSWKNFIDPFFVGWGFLQSLFILARWRPDLIIAAGGFVCAPVVWATYFLRIPVIIHQQDARPGMANKLMAPFARVVTVTLETSLEDYGKKAVWIGNPVRREIIRSKYGVHDTAKKFTLSEDLPVILVLGGGTGAAAINRLVEANIEKLIAFAQVIHLTGPGKSQVLWKVDERFARHYRRFEFLSVERMAMAYAVADIVVSRCGMGVLTELSYLGKASILIPMPDSHQEDNARVFAEKEAAIALDQNGLTGEILLANIRKLLLYADQRDRLRNNIRQVIKRGANEKMVEIIEGILVDNP